MLHRFRQFLSRPLAEDFSFTNQLVLSLQAGLYVVVFIYLFGGVQNADGQSDLIMLTLFGLNVVIASLIANFLIPRLFPKVYDEDRWTVGRHVIHTLFVLFCISVGNQMVLLLTGNTPPPYWQMYLTVTVIGFFPITLGLFFAEQRRLKRNLAHAQTLNVQLDKLHQPPLVDAPPTLPKGIVFTAENGRDKLSLLPNQLVYIESVGNYVEVHWLNLVFPQKTVLRSTLKEMEVALLDHPPFFRCHRAFIVNLKAVQKTEGNARGYQLTMSGSGQPIPVSRSYVNAFDTRMATLV